MLSENHRIKTLRYCIEKGNRGGNLTTLVMAAVTGALDIFRYFYEDTKFQEMMSNLPGGNQLLSDRNLLDVLSSVLGGQHEALVEYCFERVIPREMLMKMAESDLIWLLEGIIPKRNRRCLGMAIKYFRAAGHDKIPIDTKRILGAYFVGTPKERMEEERDSFMFLMSVFPEALTPDQIRSYFSSTTPCVHPRITAAFLEFYVSFGLRPTSFFRDKNPVISFTPKAINYIHMHHSDLIERNSWWGIRSHGALRLIRLFLTFFPDCFDRFFQYNELTEIVEKGQVHILDYLFDILHAMCYSDLKEELNLVYLPISNSMELALMAIEERPEIPDLVHGFQWLLDNRKRMPIKYLLEKSSGEVIVATFEFDFDVGEGLVLAAVKVHRDDCFLALLQDYNCLMPSLKSLHKIAMNQNTDIPRANRQLPKLMLRVAGGPFTQERLQEMKKIYHFDS